MGRPLERVWDVCNDARIVVVALMIVLAGDIAWHGSTARPGRIPVPNATSVRSDDIGNPTAGLVRATAMFPIKINGLGIKSLKAVLQENTQSTIALALCATHIFLFIYVIVWGTSYIQLLRLARRVRGKLTTPIEPEPEACTQQQRLTALNELVEQQQKALRDTKVMHDNLIKDADHRLKNNLQMMSSVISLTLRQTTDIDPKIVLKRLQERLIALGCVHDSLSALRSEPRTNIACVLDELCTHIQRANSYGKSDLRMSLRLEAIALSAQKITALALFTAEAVTNAQNHSSIASLKDASLDVALGRVPGTNRARLIIHNSTQDIVRRKKGSGLGQTLMRAFARQLDADMRTYISDGRFFVVLEFDVG